MSIKLEAEKRTDLGKGSSRRLRHENRVPGVIYGGDKDAYSVSLLHNKVMLALEKEATYSSILDLSVDGKVEKVILKDLQRHPFKPVIMHIDFQRVAAKDIIVKLVPLHFINETESKGAKAGGMISHVLNQVEVKCQVKDLPEFIEVDLAGMNIGDILHLTDLKLPKNVKLAGDFADGEHNQPVVTVHKSKVHQDDTETTATAEASTAEENAE